METPKTKFVFFGTPDFAVGVLDELEKNGFIPSLVVTAPDKPRGRKLVITPPEVKIWAEKRSIPFFQPVKLNNDAVIKLKEYSSELFIVTAYGNFLPKSVLEIPKYGTINVHPSLLPKLRGASPVQSAVLGENKTGVSIILIDEEMDHGPILSQKEIISWENQIGNLPKTSVLMKMLSKEGGILLSYVIPKYIKGEITPTIQDHSKATYSRKIEKEDGLLNLDEDSEKNFRKIQAFDIWPRAHFYFECHGMKTRVIITDADFSDGSLHIRKVLPEGEKEMPYEDFLRRQSK